MSDSVTGKIQGCFNFIFEKEALVFVKSNSRGLLWLMLVATYKHSLQVMGWDGLLVLQFTNKQWINISVFSYFPKVPHSFFFYFEIKLFLFKSFRYTCY